MAFKSLRLIGTLDLKDEAAKKRVIIVNDLNLALGALILPIGSIFYFYTRSLSILIPAGAEFILTVLAIFLNKQKHYQTAAVTTFATQCTASLYFSLLLGGILELQGMMIFLISIIYLLFADKKIRTICFWISVFIFIVLVVSLRLRIVEPAIILPKNIELLFRDLATFGVLVLVIVVNRRLVSGNDLSIVLKKSNQSIKHFFTDMFHEMRSPLNSIGLISKLMKKELKQKPEDSMSLEKYADMLIIGTTTTRTIVNNVLNMAEIEAGKTMSAVKATFFVKDFFGRLVDISRVIAKSRNIEVSIIIKGMPGLIASDPVKLNQIMTNLLTNASKYANAKSIIYVILNKTNEQWWTIEVKNKYTEPISVERLNSFFGKFVRGDENLIESTGAKLMM